jgi:predicted SAM-dependent methyltransferase
VTPKTILNLGSGRQYLPGAVNVDITPDTSPDVVHDLDTRPWPFADDSFDEIHGIDVLEHLADLLGAMEEVHRIARAGATVKIVVPHFSSPNAYTDPTHERQFGAFSFDYFTGEHLHSYYTRARFLTARRELVFKRGTANKVVTRLANRWPDRYEDRWAWMFPAWFLVFELRVVK